MSERPVQAVKAEARGGGAPSGGPPPGRPPRSAAGCGSYCITHRVTGSCEHGSTDDRVRRLLAALIVRELGDAEDNSTSDGGAR